MHLQRIVLVLGFYSVVTVALYAQDDLVKQPAALNTAGIYSVRADDPNLTGQDVKIAAICRSMTYMANQPLYDYKINSDHDCLSSGKISYPYDKFFTGSLSEHATSIGGILLGRESDVLTDDYGRFEYEGAAPLSSLDVYEFWHFIRNHVFSNQPLDADIVTLSVGVIFEDWWTRGLEQLADSQDILIVAGIGNGRDVHEPALFPAAGANILAAGVVDSQDGFDFSQSYPDHSSKGPTGDGRCKPDIVAPGNCLVPDSDNSKGYLLSGNGASFAAPVVSGTAAVLIQKAKLTGQLEQMRQFGSASCTVKAILLNSAARLPYWHKGNPGSVDDHVHNLDYQQGAGMIDAKTAVDQLEAGYQPAGAVYPQGWDSYRIEKNPSIEHIYSIELTEEQKYISATLVWNRHYEDQYPFGPMENAQSDLRLELWAIDQDNPDNDYMLDYSDSTVDNVEHIFAAVDPDFDNYQLVVSYGFEPVMSEEFPFEKYSLAWRTTDAQFSESKWWNDINADGRIDTVDRLIFSILDKNASILEVNPTFSKSILKLNKQRIRLLTENWDIYRRYITVNE